MLVNLVISLYTSRVILHTLGVSDYGIYGVVGGIVTMFGFFNGTLASATSRFLSFEIASEDKQRLKDTFSSALVLHIAIAVFVTLICETFGIWFLENKLVIPIDRMTAAYWVLQFSIFAMIFQIIQVPFNAALISHERMGVYAYVEISNSLLKLIIVYLLVIGNFDKLILYAILMLLVSAIMAIIYTIYGRLYFEECSLKLTWKKDFIKPMLYYSGWQFYGNMSIVAITQGVNMLMNMWFGTFMNAAYDIANRVKGIVMNLSTNFTTAMRPQIVISYSAQEFDRMFSLMCNAMRISFVLMLILCAPLMIETHYVLNLWLGIVPKHAVPILRLSLLWNLLVSLTLGLGDVSNATGDVKRPSIIAGTMYLSIIPITYVAFKLGAPYWVPFVLNIITVMFAPLYTSLPIKKHVPGFSWNKHVFREVMRCYVIMIIVLGGTRFFENYMEESFLRLLFTTLISTSMSCILGYYFLFPKVLRIKVLNIIKIKLSQKWSRK